MGDCARQRKRNGAVRGIPHTGRRQRLRRLLSLFLIALMVLVQPLEALGAGTTYKVDLLDTILTDSTQPSGKKRHEQQTIEAGGKVTRPEDPDAIVDQDTGTKYLFFGWFTDSCTTIGSYPLESWAYDFDKEVTNNFPLYAWYLIERTAANTKSVSDGWSETVTINKSVNKTQWFMFTPDTTGEYTISGPSNKKTNYKINWYGTDYMIYSPIYSELGPYTVNLEAGKTYYWNINLQNSNADTNSYAFTLNKEGGVEKKEIKSLTKSSISNQTYTGSEIKPSVEIKDGTTILQEGKDYTLTYSNNINVSTSSSKAKVVIEAVGSSDYTGSYTIEFWIVKADAPPNKPATTMNAAYNVKTVGELPLPEGWSWQSGYTNTALKSGQAVSAVAEYTGTDKGNYKTTTVTINITRAAAEITGFTLNADKKELKVNQEFTLEIASVTPSDADYSVSWSSSDSKVAAVDSNGKVTAKASGTATITATIGSISKTCTITVTNKVEDFSLNKTTLSMKGKETAKLSVTTTPLNPDSYTIQWSSDNPEVAAVDKDGNVTAKASGTATITASIGSISKTCKVTVTNQVEDFSLNQTKLSLKGKETAELSVASTTPENPDTYTVQWSSSKSEVAAVDGNGKVTAKASGTAIITAKIGSISRTCTISVTNKVENFSLNKTTLSLKGKETEKLSVASTTPENPDDYTVQWSSSSTLVAEVASDGTVTARGSGTAEITATIGTISKKCTVTVTNPITAFTLNKETTALVAGNAETLYVASKNPENPDAYTIAWSSSDESVATVSAGKITAKAAGTATITAAINSDGKTISQSCTVTVTAATAALEDIQITPDKMNLKAGEESAITVAPVPEGAVVGEISYSSDNESVAEVNANTGMVTAKATGTAKITITAAGKTKSCQVTVTNPITDFSLNKTNTIIMAGEEDTLSVESTTPENPDAYTITWSSSDESVATVSNGRIAAIAAGTATITAAIDSDGKTIRKSCTVTVPKPEPIPVTGITFDVAEKQLNIDEAFSITITIEPANADNKEVEWFSSDSEIAKVDQEGRVTAIAAGQAVITAIAKDGSAVSAQCIVTVKEPDPDPVPVTGITFDIVEKQLDIDETFNIIIRKIEPDDADNKEVEWVSNNPDIAVVDQSGKVTAVAAGEAVIKAMAKDGSGVFAQCKVTVNGKESDPIPVKSITFDVVEKQLNIDETFSIMITNIEPANADNKEVEWVSSNPDIAVVDQSGKVTAIAAGEVVIKAIAKDGSKVSAQCKVTVNGKGPNPNPDPGTDPGTGTTPGTGTGTGTEEIKVSSLKITGETKKVAPGKKLALTAEVYPENAGNKQVVWKVSNSKYASVNDKGVVTTKNAGKGKKVVVTATSVENSSIQAVYNISIMKKAVKKVKLTGKKTLKVGKSTKLKAKLTPTKGISKEVKWISSNPKIAAVNAKGKVTAKAKGKVKITAQAKDGSGKKASITIKIK